MSQLLNVTQRTILFLIADTGAGHRSAANAISNAIKIIAEQKQEAWHARHHTDVITASQQADQAAELPPPVYRIEIVDVFEEYSRFPLREAVKLYGPTIRYNPKLFGEFFHRSNREDTVLAVNSLATPLILNGLLRLFTTVQPDVIVSIHPMLNHVTVRALKELQMHIPFLTVVTDLVSVHYAWFAPGVDAYLVCFVHNMPALMHASDEIITKAGPGTICEALACNLPVILSGYVPGQEEGNVEYVTGNNVGVLALDSHTLIDALRRIIKPGSPEMREWLENARRISRPGASFDIAGGILSYLPACHEPGIWSQPQAHYRQRKMSGRLQSAIRLRKLRTHLPRPLLRRPVMQRIIRRGARQISDKFQSPQSGRTEP